MTYEEWKRRLKAKNIKERKDAQIASKKSITASEFLYLATKSAKNIKKGTNWHLKEVNDAELARRMALPTSKSPSDPNSAFRRKKGMKKVSVWPIWHKISEGGVPEEENYVHDEDDVLNDIHSHGDTHDDGNTLNGVHAHGDDEDDNIDEES